MKRYIKIISSLLILTPLVSNAYLIAIPSQSTYKNVNTSAQVNGVSNARQNAASVVAIGDYKANAIGSGAQAELLIPVSLSNTSIGAMNSNTVNARSGGSDVSNITMKENNNNSGNTSSFEALPATLIIGQ